MFLEDVTSEWRPNKRGTFPVGRMKAQRDQGKAWVPGWAPFMTCEGPAGSG